MKKTLVSALTGALVIGATATTFAAANPFEDVPADHWAYDAVAQLAADGVIEGYGDGTYRGDQEITEDQAKSLGFTSGGYGSGRTGDTLYQIKGNTVQGKLMRQLKSNQGFT
ncbi:MAG: S-layer homology domain-containing protein, partial [Negativicutes bacterium]